VAGGNRGLQDGSTHSAKFSWPYGVAMSPNGNTLYVADSGNDCIRAISLDAGASSSPPPCPPPHQPAPNPSLRGGTLLSHTAAPLSPSTAAAPAAPLDPAHTLPHADGRRSGGSTHSTGMVSTIAGGGAGSRGFQDGLAAKAKFAWPYGVATSPDGHTLYVADSGNNRIRSVDLLSGLVGTLAGAGVAGYQDGAASAARFYGPRGVVASPDGSLVFVADYSNFRVRTLELVRSLLQRTTVRSPRKPY
jgi:sugar lactone lactonase YvrE